MACKSEEMDQDPLDLVMRNKELPEDKLLEEIKELRNRHAGEFRSLEDDYRQRHQHLQDAHEKEIQTCIRRYFAKNDRHSGSGSPQTLHISLESSISPNQHSIHSTIGVPTYNTLASRSISPGNYASSATPSQQSNTSEEWSGRSQAVRHKLQEHLLQRHMRECQTCSTATRGDTSVCICGQASALTQRAVGNPVKNRPVIRTYSSPLPLANPNMMQPFGSPLLFGQQDMTYKVGENRGTLRSGAHQLKHKPSTQK